LLIVLEELRCPRCWDVLIPVTSDEQLADRVVRRSIMAEEAKQVDEKAGLGVTSFHPVGARESDFAPLEIFANLGSRSELPFGDRAFPVEDARRWFRQSCSEVEKGIVPVGTASRDFRHS
jgi:hypothetical protein